MLLMIVWVLIPIVSLILSFWGFTRIVEEKSNWKMLTFSALSLCAWLLSLTVVSVGSPMSGEKIGVFTKINYSGYVYKTYEAQIIRGGMNNGSGNFGQAFDFTVPTNMVQEANKALDGQKEVKIYYHKPLVCFTFTSENDCIFLDKIEVR